MVALTIDIWNAAGEVTERHTFFAPTEREARRLMELHADDCVAFQEAEEEGRIGEFAEHIASDEVPEANDYAVDAEPFEPDEVEEEALQEEE